MAKRGREHQCVPPRCHKTDRPHVHRVDRGQNGTEWERRRERSSRAVEYSKSRIHPRDDDNTTMMIVWEGILVVMRTTESIIY